MVANSRWLRVGQHPPLSGCCGNFREDSDGSSSTPSHSHHSETLPIMSSAPLLTDPRVSCRLGPGWEATETQRSPATSPVAVNAGAPGVAAPWIRSAVRTPCCNFPLGNLWQAIGQAILGRKPPCKGNGITLGNPSNRVSISGSIACANVVFCPVTALFFESLELANGDFVTSDVEGCEPVAPGRSFAQRGEFHSDRVDEEPGSPSESTGLACVAERQSRKAYVTANR